jgi:hypothetical protein
LATKASIGNGSRLTFAKESICAGMVIIATAALALAGCAGTGAPGTPRTVTLTTAAAPSDAPTTPSDSPTADAGASDDSAPNDVFQLSLVPNSDDPGYHCWEGVCWIDVRVDNVSHGPATYFPSSLRIVDDSGNSYAPDNKDMPDFADLNPCFGRN